MQFFEEDDDVKEEHRKSRRTKNAAGSIQACFRAP